jgi:hypothetical protein
MDITSAFLGITKDQLCQCGCRLPTSIAQFTDLRRGHKKGQPLPLRQGHSLTGKGRRKTIRVLEEDQGFTSPCWIWQLKLDKVGYGRTKVANRDWLAHRLYYTNYVGEIPVGFVVDHLCSIKACVNPGHLEAITPQENEWRAWMKRASLTAEQIKSLREWMTTNMSPDQLTTLWSGYRWSNGRN